jgi:hypothetical protein
MGITGGTLTMETLKAQGYVGRTSDGSRLWIEITLEPQAGREGWQTVEHEQVPERFYRLSITDKGLVKGSTARRRNDIDFAGQCGDELAHVAQPAKGWTAEQLADLLAIWDEWHLNDLTAGCAHQHPWVMPDRYGRNVPSLMFTKRCPETGYRYGHGWLVRTLPADVVTRVREHMDRLDGTSALGD